MLKSTLMPKPVIIVAGHLEKHAKPSSIQVKNYSVNAAWLHNLDRHSACSANSSFAYPRTSW